MESIYCWDWLNPVYSFFFFNGVKYCKAVCTGIPDDWLVEIAFNVVILSNTAVNGGSTRLLQKGHSSGADLRPFLTLAHDWLVGWKGSIQQGRLADILCFMCSNSRICLSRFTFMKVVTRSPNEKDTSTAFKSQRKEQNYAFFCKTSCLLFTGVFDSHPKTSSSCVDFHKLLCL